MTPDEQYEWNVINQTRCNILTDGRRSPTTEERELARAEADAWLADQNKQKMLL